MGNLHKKRKISKTTELVSPPKNYFKYPSKVNEDFAIKNTAAKLNLEKAAIALAPTESAKNLAKIADRSVSVGHRENNVNDLLRIDNPKFNVCSC